MKKFKPMNGFWNHISFIKYSTNCNNRHGFVIIKCNSKLVAWFTLNLVCLFIETYLKILIRNWKDQNKTEIS